MSASVTVGDAILESIFDNGNLKQPYYYLESGKLAIKLYIVDEEIYNKAIKEYITSLIGPYDDYLYRIEKGEE